MVTIRSPVLLWLLAGVMLASTGCQTIEAAAGSEPSATLVVGTATAVPVPVTSSSTATVAVRLATPTPPLRAASPPTPSPSMAARAAARTQVERAAAIASASQFPQRDQITAALEAALRDYVKGVASIPTLQASPRARTDLVNVMTLPPAAGSSTAARRPTVDLARVGKNTPVLLVSYRLPGLPLLAAYVTANQVRSVSLTPGPPPDLPKSTVYLRFDRTADFGGDGQNQLVISRTAQGERGVTTAVGVLGWDGNRFVTLFSTTMSQWAGPATWAVVPHGMSQDLVVRCPALGPFDHKLLPHPQLTRTYRWNKWGFVLASATLDPVAFQRDAFDRAEVAFRAGDFATAIPRYRVVVNGRNLQPDKASNTDWSALAWLRIGEIQAVSGDSVGARQSLDQAVQAGGTIGELGRTLRAALDQPDGVTRGFAALQTSDVPERLHEETARDVGFEVDAPGLLYPGLAISSYLQNHPKAATLSVHDLQAALQQLGLKVTDLTQVDLDGDGQNEIVAILPVGTSSTGWIVTHEAGRWRALLIENPGVTWVRVGERRARPDHAPGQALGLVLAATGNDSPPQMLVSLANGQPRLYTPNGTPLPQADTRFPDECSIAEGLGPKR